MLMSLEELIKTRTKEHWPYRVDVYRDRVDDQMEAWCKKNCKQDYHILLLSPNLHIARFKSNRDMVLFSLTWS